MATVTPINARLLRQRQQDLLTMLEKNHGVPRAVLDELLGIDRLLAGDHVRASMEDILRGTTTTPDGTVTDYELRMR